MKEEFDEGSVCSINEIDPNAVARVRGKALPDEVLDRLGRLFSAYGDSTRLKILHALACEDELCVCDLAVISDLSVSAASHQLRLLRDRNLVKARRDGRMVYYRLADAHVSEIMQTGLDHVQE